MLGPALVYIPVLVATALWAAAEVIKLRRRDHVEPARSLWTAGLGLMMAHVLAALDVVYGWNLDAAARATARQTLDVTGIAWTGGIFVNYAFVACWIADAAWWWAAPGSYSRRPAAIERGRLAVFVFMFFNAAIVFGSTAGRLVGVPAIAAVGAAWLADRRRRLIHV